MDAYKKIEERYIDEVNSTCSIYLHIKTKAKICTIKNDDRNKVFSIAFRTPAINSSGLTHILEHSVLCGSKKYPIKAILGNIEDAQNYLDEKTSYYSIYDFSEFNENIFKYIFKCVYLPR